MNAAKMRKPKIVKKIGNSNFHVCAIYSDLFGCGLLHEENNDVAKIYVDLEDPRPDYKDMNERQAHIGFWSPDGFQFKKYDHGVKDHVDVYLIFSQLVALRDHLDQLIASWSENPTGGI